MLIKGGPVLGESQFVGDVSTVRAEEERGEKKNFFGMASKGMQM